MFYDLKNCTSVKIEKALFWQKYDLVRSVTRRYASDEVRNGCPFLKINQTWSGGVLVPSAHMVFLLRSSFFLFRKGLPQRWCGSLVVGMPKFCVVFSSKFAVPMKLTVLGLGLWEKRWEERRTFSWEEIIIEKWYFCLGSLWTSIEPHLHYASKKNAKEGTWPSSEEGGQEMEYWKTLGDSYNG